MIITPTGGLTYHLRAWRFRERLWTEYRASLNHWLSNWQPSENALLLIGPSGGYSLESGFLNRFEPLSAIDPDPVARALFRRRFGSRIQWSTKDYFTPRKGRYAPERLRSLLNLHPAHAVLFCNFLGQLPFLNPLRSEGPSYSEWKARLPELLQGRSWASFHDRLSGSLAPLADLGSRSFTDRVSDDRILAEFYPSPSGSGQIELSDHLTGDLFPGMPRTFFRWQITPGSWHLIEAVRNPA